MHFDMGVCWNSSSTASWRCLKDTTTPGTHKQNFCWILSKTCRKIFKWGRGYLLVWWYAGMARQLLLGGFWRKYNYRHLDDEFLFRIDQKVNIIFQMGRRMHLDIEVYWIGSSTASWWCLKDTTTPGTYRKNFCWILSKRCKPIIKWGRGCLWV